VMAGSLDGPGYVHRAFDCRKADTEYHHPHYSGMPSGDDGAGFFAGGRGASLEALIPDEGPEP